MISVLACGSRSWGSYSMDQALLHPQFRWRLIPTIAAITLTKLNIQMTHSFSRWNTRAARFLLSCSHIFSAVEIHNPIHAALLLLFYFSHQFFSSLPLTPSLIDTDSSASTAGLPYAGWCCTPLHSVHTFCSSLNPLPLLSSVLTLSHSFPPLFSTINSQSFSIFLSPCRSRPLAHSPCWLKLHTGTLILLVQKGHHQ